MLFANFIDLFLESAPWLLLGLLLAGMLKMFVPMSWMHKQLGGHGFKSTLKAALLGAPLPLCSCGVIPAAVGLRRSGASKAATTSFLVSTPETGVDSVTISYVLLGPFMAVVRPIAAVISAVTAGLLVGRDEQFQEIKTQAADRCHTHNSSQPVQSSCSCEKESNSTCSGGSIKQHKHKHSGTANVECCDSTKDIAQELQGAPIRTRILKGLHFAATDLVRDTTVWLLIGLFFAAVVQTYVPADFLAKWGDGILAMLVMVIVSIPMYICATASTPIAAGLLLAGVSPGAVLVFMLAGPATNIATLGVVAKELGKRALWGYLGGVLGVALLSGVVVNYLAAEFGFVVMPQIGEQNALLPEALVYSSAVVLAVLMAKVFFDMLLLKRAGKSSCS
ncbi:SO_0444 family Cu/Zn efflux transporter [Psychromonas aquimarina]|uniref:SO_0444 family Cu/Zn efflux transporter n=1 Tax=Psychromonas aquimarina TaxID=444919 RepID=UPI000428EF33|nr:SO_0444 family Cu/Zn efflux transporter [Psychromonas aquimarina]